MFYCRQLLGIPYRANHCSGADSLLVSTLTACQHKEPRDLDVHPVMPAIPCQMLPRMADLDPGAVGRHEAASNIPLYSVQQPYLAVVARIRLGEAAVAVDTPATTSRTCHRDQCISARSV